MKALVLHAPGDLRLEERPDPVPGPGEALLRIRASGICGSDIARVMTKGTYSFPMIPGHEFAGEVVSLGPGTDPSLLGRTCAAFPLLPCRACDSCAIGEYAACRSYDYFGSRRDGGFAELLAVPAWNLVPAPDGLSFEEAAMAEPAAVALHALRRGGLSAGDDTGVAGAGPVGLLLAAWARVGGSRRVFLWDIDPRRVAFARSLGHDRAFDSRETDPVEAIREATGGRMLDLAVEGAGVSATLEQCLRAARPGGVVVAMGHPAGAMTLSREGYWEILRKQLDLRGTWNSSYTDLPKNEWKLVLETMADGRLDTKPFITHRLRLEDGPEAFRTLLARSEFSNKVMFLP